MKFSHEEKRTPVFRTWASNADVTPGTRFPIIRVFSNSEWRTVTFVTEEFRVNFKYATTKEFDSTHRGLTKVFGSACRAYVEYLGELKCDITLLPASDADESPQKFTKDDFGWSS